MNKLTINDLDVNGKRVLMRVDFNVPQNEDGTVRDDTRILAALKSINYVRDNGGMLILMSHLGRPKNPDKAENEAERSAIIKKNQQFKMDPVADALRALVGGTVQKVDDIVGPEVEKAVRDMKPGDIIVLENTRFHSGETKNDEELSKRLASLADVYVSDAFGSLHRAHASTEGVAHHVKQAAAGFLVAKEIEFFDKILSNPDRPLTAILGGAKVSDKILVIENLLNLVDKLVIGGGMSYTFLKAQGYEIGDSLLDKDGIEVAKNAMQKAKEKGVELLLPVDFLVADDFSETANSKIVDATQIQPGWQGLDIGPKTRELFKQAIASSKMVVWNGPVGVFEMKKFSGGTHELAKALAENKNVTSIIGGGDTAAAIRQFGLEDEMSHVSTGGGASLEMLEGKELPGVAALTDK
jgi:phosphoglycerate kinase